MRDESEKLVLEEIKVTPEMIEAGVDALMRASMNDEDLTEFPEIVRSVFLAMMAARE